MCPPTVPGPPVHPFVGNPEREGEGGRPYATGAVTPPAAAVRPPAGPGREGPLQARPKRGTLPPALAPAANADAGDPTVLSWGAGRTGRLGQRNDGLHVRVGEDHEGSAIKDVAVSLGGNTTYAY